MSGVPDITMFASTKKNQNNIVNETTFWHFSAPKEKKVENPLSFCLNLSLSEKSKQD